MTINWVGNFQNNVVGEVGDSTHLTRELEGLGHTVRKIPQDEWREYCKTGSNYPNIPNEMEADINVICKWHHFDSGLYADELRVGSGAPVFYWVWDYMHDQGFPEWHLNMIKYSDLYLGNDVRSIHYPEEVRDKLYYFPFDVADSEIYKNVPIQKKEYDVVFFGSWIGQGDRQEWLKEINKTNPVKVFSWNYLDWPKEFEDVNEAVYGQDFVREAKKSKIILGFNVEPNSWGYWSNRTGKTMLSGSFLLQQYAPGMELFLRDGVEYFSSVEEAREKIDHYLIADTERENIARNGWIIANERMSSKERIKDLVVLMERFLKKGDSKWQT